LNSASAITALHVFTIGEITLKTFSSK